MAFWDEVNKFFNNPIDYTVKAVTEHPIETIALVGGGWALGSALAGGATAAAGAEAIGAATAATTVTELAPLATETLATWGPVANVVVDGATVAGATAATAATAAAADLLPLETTTIASTPVANVVLADTVASTAGITLKDVADYAKTGVSLASTAMTANALLNKPSLKMNNPTPAGLALAPSNIQTPEVIATTPQGAILTPQQTAQTAQNGALMSNQNMMILAGAGVALFLLWKYKGAK